MLSMCTCHASVALKGLCQTTCSSIGTGPHCKSQQRCCALPTQDKTIVEWDLLRNQHRKTLEGRWRGQLRWSGGWHSTR
jgi:hypothetical protein